MNRVVEKQPVDFQGRRARIWGTILRTIGGLLTVAFGAFLAVGGVAIVWSVLAPIIRTQGYFLYSYGIQIGGITLKGWEIFACAALFFVVGIGLVLFGLSLFLKRRRNE